MIRAKKSRSAARAEMDRKAAKLRKTAKSMVTDSSVRAGAIIVGVVALLGVAMLIAQHDASNATASAQPSGVVEAASADRTPATSASPRVKKASTAPDANAPKAAAPPAPVPASAVVSNTITVAGCVERAGGSFRLKDPSGEDAPKARSWKSGFLKKSSKPIALTGVADTNVLASQVGRRVSVTGTLIDDEMRVHSLRRLAASCK
jgi:type IV secretory pathway VirB10-like protein